MENNYSLSITVRTSFIAFHRYADAPEEVSFLRDWHRHKFCVEMAVPVDHSNRDVEFFILQRKLNKYIEEKYEDKYFELSCEAIAEQIAKQFSAIRVSVSEDGESDGVAQLSYIDIN